MIAQKSLRCHFVPVHGSHLRHAVETRADFDAFGRVDTHHGAGQFGIQFAIDGCAQARRDIARDYIDPGADRITGFSQAIHVRLEFGDPPGVRAEKGIVVDTVPIHHLVGTDRTQLRKPALYFHRKIDFEPFSGHSARGDPHRGLAGG